MADELGERTEAPSARKLEEARERGQVAKSIDLSGAIDLLGAAAVIVYFGGDLFTNAAGMVRAVLAGAAPGSGPSPGGLDELFAWTGGHAVRIAAPMLGVMFAVVYLAQFMQVHWLFSTQPLAARLDRIDPLAGLARVFGRRNIVKGVVAVVKLTLILIIAAVFIGRSFTALAVLPRFELLAGFAHMGRMIIEMIAWILVVMLTIGVADYFYQRWQYTQDLRMTKQEVKQERRSMDGDPEIKGRRLRMARQLVLQRLGQAVPRADVIVTNPTHFSVALRYDSENMEAPKVVAKGADELAFRIRALAIAHGVPIVEKPALARALYAKVEVGRAIAPEYFEAVAEVLAYVYRLAGKAA